MALHGHLEKKTERLSVAGPLIVSKTNPRYFAIPSRDGAEERLVYLTGAHVNNLHDGLGFGAECPEAAERFDFGDYLDFLETHGRARQRRRPPIPRCQQRQWRRHPLDRRLPGPAARPRGPGASGGVHPQGC